MNLLTLMPKLKPEIIKMLAEKKRIPISSVPLLKLDDALTILEYGPLDREYWVEQHCTCNQCKYGGLVLLKAWRDQRDKPDNNPRSV